jgi:hypothetical protein
VRGPCALSAFESAELTVAEEDELKYYVFGHYLVLSLSNTQSCLFFMKTRQWIMSKNIIFVLIYHRQKLLEELTEIRNNRRPKLKHSSTDMAPFWLSLQQEHPSITMKATEALHSFSTSYVCEANFSATNMMKSKNK